MNVVRRFAESIGRRVAWALGALALTGPLPARGDSPARAPETFVMPVHLALDAPAPAAADWRAEATAWVWMLGVEGDTGVGNRVADVNANFCDILDASDSVLAFSGRVELGKGRWGAFVDGIYADVGADDQSGPLGLSNIDVTMQMAVIDFGLMYRISEWPTDGRAGRPATLDLYAGGRWTNLDLELDPANLSSNSGSEDWLDPIVGAKLVLPLGEKWRVSANGDVGGFGVESDFTWSATTVLGYDFKVFNAAATVYAGYRAISQDYSDGSGASAFQWDVVLHGPILGLSLRF